MLRSRSRSDGEVALVRGGCGLHHKATGSLAALAVTAVLASGPALAQQATSLNGPPVQVQPTAMEPGVPLITITPGTPNPFPSPDPVPGAGVGDPGAEGDPGAGGGGGGGAGPPGGPSLDTMLATPWGAAAVSNAQALGVNPSAIAAMCVMESQCRNIPNGSGSTASGPFQMIDQTYNAMIAAAARDNPELAASFAGKSDPATMAAAAAELVKTEALALQSRGVANPTVLDVRGGYAFGDSHLVQVSQAPDGATLGSILPNWTAATYRANGLTPETTVGQWRQTVINKIGPTANQPILLRR